MGDEVVFRVEEVRPEVLYEIRRRVLRNNDPQVDVTNPRDLDPTTLHLGGFLATRLVVSASFFLAPSPADATSPAYQLRYMATDAEVRGRGLGTRVLLEAERRLESRGVRLLWANARDSAIEFYLRNGWHAVAGSEHLSAETGIPHTVIVKHLQPAS